MFDLAELLQFARTQQHAKNWEQAEQAYRTVLSQAPTSPEIRRELAWLLHRRGDTQGGLVEMRRAVAEGTAWAALHNDLGMMLRQSGRVEESLPCFQQAIRLDPTIWQAQFNLGNAYREVGRCGEAVECYVAALRGAPDDADVHLNLGVAHKELGQFAAARASCRRALELRPNFAGAWINLGIIAKSEAQIAEAVECYRRALQINPRSALAHYNLGLALRASNDLSAAIDHFQSALGSNPAYAAAYRGLGEVYEAQGNTSEAIAAYREAWRLSGDPGHKVRAALTLPVILESREQIEEVRARLSRELDALAAESPRILDPLGVGGSAAFGLAYHGRNERIFQSQIAEILRAAAPQLSYVAPHCAKSRSRPRGRRIKLGFVSMHFRTHTIAKLNAGLIERLDRKRFEVSVFRFPAPEDAMSARIAKSADRCITLPPRIEMAQARIAEQELDVLFYTDIGIDAITYLLAFARLAPVQCVTWGHPLTTGIQTLDYFVSSHDLEVADADAHYREKLVRLPCLGNYYFRPQQSPSTKTRQDFGLSDKSRVYACLQSLFKLHPDDDAVFAEILRRDPAGTLLLLEGQFPHWTDLLKRRLQVSMPDVAGRVRFVPQQSPADFSRLLALADVLLDPLHFGGGDTSYQSFAVGAPVVALPGGFLRSRITYALYRAMGLSECIAATRADYVDRAVRIANDAAFGDEIRAQILASNQAIYENAAAVTAMENFFLEAIESDAPRAT